MKKIYVQFCNYLYWVDAVEWLDPDTAIIQWDEPGMGRINATAKYTGEICPETGERIYHCGEELTVI